MNDQSKDRGDWRTPTPANLPPLPPRYDRPSAATTTQPHRVPAQDHGHVTAPLQRQEPSPAVREEPVQQPSRGGAGRVVLASFAAAVIGAASALGGAYALGAFDETVVQNGTGTTIVKEQATPATGGNRGVDVVKVAEAVRPAIVNIQVASNRGQGAGSGVVFRSDGLIMTNNHVVEGARTVKVVFPDGRTLDGTVLGTDAETDIAVVKVEATDLPVAPLGSAADLRIGQPTIAIGNPLGLAGGPSVSEGIVSALGREVRTQGSVLLDMIQTDAAISPGSSGGALLDGNGSVIGITTAIAVSEAGAEGIGFATPIEIAQKVAEDIVADGRAEHPFLGIRGVDAENQGGAVVVEVTSGSPAQKAGLQPEDVITAVEGSQVTSMSGLKVRLRTFSPGDDVRLTVDGKEVTVTLGSS